MRLNSLGGNGSAITRAFAMKPMCAAHVVRPMPLEHPENSAESTTRVRWWHRVYTQVLRAYPVEFRTEWAHAMEETFADRVRIAEKQRGATPWDVIANEISNVLLTGVRERFSSGGRPSALFHLQDVRYAVRLLARSPGFALLTVLVLAGGLGVSTFTFSFLHTAMIRPLQLDEGDRIVRVTRQEQGRRTTTNPIDLATIRPSIHTLRDVGGYTKHEIMLGRGSDTRVASATIAEPVLFKVARTPALFGRTLLPVDAAPGAEPVIVLSYRLWETEFAADRNAVNSLVSINGTNTRVVGVMPKGFGFPVTQDAWLPLRVNENALASADQEELSVFGRLAPGVSHTQAVAEVSALLQRSISQRDTAQLASRNTVLVESFPAAQIGSERNIVFTSLNVVAALILLLALVNVITLLTARSNERVRETAVRLALGASRGRLIVQGMWESVILCVIGGAVGTAGAAWGLDAITNWTRINMTSGMAFWWVWQMDHVTILSAGAFVTAAIVVLGSVVSLRATRTDVREVMQDGGVRSGSRNEGRLSRILITTQVTTVTVLMFVGVLSGIMARRVATIDPGYDASHLLQVSFEPPASRFPNENARVAVFRTIAERLGEQSAFDGVLLRRKLADKTSGAARFALREAAGAMPSANIVAAFGAMSTLGITLKHGRLLERGDDQQHLPVVVVSQSLAARYWPTRSPVGEQIRLAGVTDTLVWRNIVGVVSDIPYGNQLARDRSADAVYVPLLQTDAPWADVIVRYRASEVDGRRALNAAFSAIDPSLVPGFVYRSSEVFRQSGLVTTGMTKLFGACFMFALLLAVAGAYGLMSRSIGLRTREIGVRRALGASDATATRMLLAQGARTLGRGTLFALPLLAGIGAATAHYAPISGALTAIVGVLVSLAIVGVVLGATWLPTRKVLRVSLRDALWRD